VTIKDPTEESLQTKISMGHVTNITARSIAVVQNLKNTKVRKKKS
jgi:hypothetical protein